MYFIDAVSVLARRWYILLAGMLLMACGAVAVVLYVPTQYQASGQMVLLLPPGASGTGKPINPYLNLQAGLTTAASLVSGSASTKDVQRELKGQGFDSEYAVAVVPGTGPLITVSAKDTDPAVAVGTRDAVMAWVSQELGRIQDEVAVPESQYISATPSSVSRRAEALPGSKLRALAGVAALGAILTLGATFGLDRLLRRRSARRRPKEESTSSADDEASPLDRTSDGPVPIKRPATPVAMKPANGSGSTRPNNVGAEAAKRPWIGRRTGSGG